MEPSPVDKTKRQILSIVGFTLIVMASMIVGAVFLMSQDSKPSLSEKVVTAPL